MTTDIETIAARLDSLSVTVAALTAAPAARSYDDRGLIGELESLRAELNEVKAGNRTVMDSAIAQVQGGARAAAKSSMMQVAKQSVDLIVEVQDDLEGKIRSARAETADRLNDAKTATNKFKMLAEIQAQTASAHIIKYLAGRI